MKARYLVTGLAVAMTGVAMHGSAASLHEIAVEDHLAAAWTMPFCLDLLAITTTMAAVLTGQRGILVRVGPPVAYAVSLALQVSAAWSYGPRAWAVHAIPLAAAGYLSEVLLRIWAPVVHEATHTTEDKPATGPDEVAAVAHAGSEAATVGQQLTLSGAEPAAAARRTRPRAAPRPRSDPVSMDDLVRRAEQAGRRRGVSPLDLSQATLKTDSAIHRVTLFAEGDVERRREHVRKSALWGDCQMNGGSGLT
jgi:hypothetical protein